MPDFMTHCGSIVTVDAQHLVLCESQVWRIFPGGEVVSDGGQSLRQLVLGPFAPAAVKHLNGKSLDFRTSNLQESTPGRRAPIPGVTFENGSWRARFRRAGSHVHVGYFSTQEEAARALRLAKRVSARPIKPA